jgi:hypothetical protein
MDCGLEQIHVMKLTPWPMQIIAPMRAVFCSSISGMCYGQGNQLLEVMHLDC